MKKAQKLLSILLLLAMLLTLLPTAALAEEPEEEPVPAGDGVYDPIQDGDGTTPPPSAFRETADDTSPCTGEADEDEEPVREGEMTWTDLQAALNEGGEIVLSNDVTASAEDSALVVPADVTATLDLNGHTLDRGLSADTMEAEGNVISVSSGAVLLMSGGTVTGGGNNGSGGGICVDAGAVLELTNVTVSGNTCTDHGGGIYLAADAQCSAVSSSIDGNRTTVGENGSGGGVYFAGGTLHMTDCSVSDNRSQNLGGGLYVGAGSALLTGCEIDRNDAYANACGGGVFLSGGTLRLEDCEITGNTSSKTNPHALGVFVNNTATFIVSGDTRITDNRFANRQMNVFLHNGALIRPDGLADTALIGVGVGKTNSSYVAEYRAGTVTEGLPGNGTGANFSCDVSNYRLGVYPSGEAFLGPPTTVSFAAGDSSATGSMDSVSVAIGSVYTLPECAFAVAGKVFAGWLVSTTGALMQPGDTITAGRNATLTAQWKLLADGYYLIGPEGWSADDIDPAWLFAENPDNPGEYQLQTRLNVGDEIKVVRVEDDEITGWWPGGSAENYAVDLAHAGEVKIYFKTDYVDAWAEFGGYFFIEVQTPLFSVTVSDSIEHGTVTADRKYAAAGETVTLTVTPDEGYGLVSLTRVTGDEDHFTDITDKDENGNYYFLMPSGNVSVTAKFERLPITVSFDACGGTVAPESVEFAPGTAIGTLPTPERAGWVFLGWFTEPAETAFTAAQGTPVTAETTFDENATVYAHWRLPGDINGDGSVNNKDVTRLARWLKGDEVEVVALNLDVNGDGKINNKDLTRLQRYLKNKDVEIH